MTTYTGTYIPECNNDIQYRAWGRAISDAFAALSPDVTLVSTTTDWGTVGAEGTTIKPVTSNTMGPYSVYRFNDTAQTTGAPVYFQVSFYGGSNTVGGLYPYLTIHLGVTYGGSGQLTSVGSLGILNYQPTSGASPTSAAREIAASTDGSGVAFSFGMNGANALGAGVFIIDRFRDEDGLPLTDGWAGVISQSGLPPNTFNLYVTVDPVSGTGQTLNGAWPAIGLDSLGTTTSTLNTAGETTLFPVWVGNRFGTYTLKMAMSYTEVDFSPTPGTFSTTILGSTRTYRRLGPLRGGFDITTSAGALCSIWWSD